MGTVVIDPTATTTIADTTTAMVIAAAHRLFHRQWFR